MSNSNNKKGAATSQGIENFFIALFMALAPMTKITWMGLRKIKLKSEEFISLTPLFLVLIWAISFADFAHLRLLHFLWPQVFSDGVVELLEKIPMWGHFLMLLVFGVYTLGICLGFSTYKNLKILQKQLDSVALSNGVGVSPKVIREIKLDDNRSKLLIVARGIGIERFETKKSDLEASFERIIEGFSISENRKTLEIQMSKRVLKKDFSFYSAMTENPKPYHFVIGESVNGVLSVNIKDLPHLLIAGSTGGGKSAFFRQVFVTLLKHSPHLQVYLIDLKQGVEVKEFSQIPNVRVAKDEAQAVQLLTAIKFEMHKRFEFMENKGIKKIDPFIHKKDLIVIGIDEASVLFGKTSVSSSKKEMVAMARDLTDDIAKLARAAGIHLVIATQKAIKESLDTKVLENLGGRMVFKMSTHAGSNTALGNVKAYSLPDIKGRGIWAGGNKFIEVQAPYLLESDLDEECKEIAEQFKKSEIKNHQSMIELEKPQTTIKNSPASGEIDKPIVVA